MCIPTTGLSGSLKRGASPESAAATSASLLPGADKTAEIGAQVLADRGGSHRAKRSREPSQIESPQPPEASSAVSQSERDATEEIGRRSSGTGKKTAKIAETAIVQPSSSSSSSCGASFSVDPLAVWGTLETPLNPTEETLKTVLDSLRDQTLQSGRPDYWKEVLVKARETFLRNTSTLDASEENALDWSFLYENQELHLPPVHSALPAEKKARLSTLKFCALVIHAIAKNFTALPSGAAPEEITAIETRFDAFFCALHPMGPRGSLQPYPRWWLGEAASFPAYEALIQTALSQDFPITEKTKQFLLQKASGSRSLAGVLLRRERFMARLTLREIHNLALYRISKETFPKDALDPVVKKYILEREKCFEQLLLLAANNFLGKELEVLLEGVSLFSRAPQDRSLLYTCAFAILFREIEKKPLVLTGTHSDLWEKIGVEAFLDNPSVLEKVSEKVRAGVLAGIAALRGGESLLEKMLKTPGYIDPMSQEAVGFAVDQVRRYLDSSFVSKSGICFLLSDPSFAAKLNSSLFDVLLPPLCQGVFYGQERQKVFVLLQTLCASSSLSQKGCNALFSLSIEKIKENPFSVFRGKPVAKDSTIWEEILCFLLKTETVELSEESYDRALDYFESAAQSSASHQGLSSSHYPVLYQDFFSPFLDKLTKEGISLAESPARVSASAKRLERAAALLSHFNLSENGREMSVEILNFHRFFSKGFLEDLFIKTIEKSDTLRALKIEEYHGPFFKVLNALLENPSLFSQISSEKLDKGLVEMARRWQAPFLLKLLEKGGNALSGAAVGRALDSLDSLVRTLDGWWEAFDPDAEVTEDGEDLIEEIVDALFEFIEKTPGKEIPKESLLSAISKFTEKDAWLHRVMDIAVMQIIEYCSQKGWNDVWLELPSDKRGRALRMAARVANQNVFSLFVQNPAFLEEIPNRFFDSRLSIVELLQEAGWTGSLEEIEDSDGSGGGQTPILDEDSDVEDSEK